MDKRTHCQCVHTATDRYQLVQYDVDCPFPQYEKPKNSTTSSKILGLQTRTSFYLEGALIVCSFEIVKRRTLESNQAIREGALNSEDEPNSLHRGSRMLECHFINLNYSS